MKKITKPQQDIIDELSRDGMSRLENHRGVSVDTMVKRGIVEASDIPVIVMSVINKVRFFRLTKRFTKSEEGAGCKFVEPPTYYVAEKVGPGLEDVAPYNPDELKDVPFCTICGEMLPFDRHTLITDGVMYCTKCGAASKARMRLMFEMHRADGGV